MNYRIINQKTRKKVSFEQKQVFLKLMAAHGPQRISKNGTSRALRAYRKAQKDFKEIYGFTPEAIYGGNE